MTEARTPALLILNQMAGPMTWELAEDAGRELDCVAMLTGHPDTLAKGSTEQVQLFPAAPYQRGSFARRALTWIHYSLQAFFWLWRWPKTIPMLLFSNPPILCWVGWWLKKLRGQRYSVMVHDIYPDVLMRLSGYTEQHLLIRIWRWLNRRAYENAEVVMTLGQLMAENLERQFDSRKTRGGKVKVVPPWVDTEKIKPIPKAENWFAQKYDQVDKLTVMYAGNMGLGHDIETMLEAARQLQHEPGIHFMFIGEGPKWKVVEAVLQRETLPNVTLLPWQPEEWLPYQLATADIGLVSLEDEIRDLAVPSKTFYMMAAGSAVIGISQQNSGLRLIEDFRCGYVVAPIDKSGLAQAIYDLFSDHQRLDLCREAARSAAESVFSRSVNARSLITVVVS